MRNPLETRCEEASCEDWGDELTRLYEAHAERIFGYCLYRLGNRGEAEDAAQTTFLYVGRALRRGVEPENELAWLFTIAHNVCRTTRRNSRRRRSVETQQDPQVLQALSPAIEHDNDALLGLEDALSCIPENQRKAIILREWHGAPYREIAATLGLTQAAVEMLVFRGRRSLASALDNGAKRVTRRRIAGVFDGASLLSLLRGALGGLSPATVTAATGIAAVAVATGGATGSAPAPRAQAPTGRAGSSALATQAPVRAQQEAARTTAYADDAKRLHKQQTAALPIAPSVRATGVRADRPAAVEPATPSDSRAAMPTTVPTSRAGGTAAQPPQVTVPVPPTPTVAPPPTPHVELPPTNAPVSPPSVPVVSTPAVSLPTLPSVTVPSPADTAAPPTPPLPKLP